MFSSVGLFKNISCPRQHDCGLPNCIFSHITPAPSSEEYNAPYKEYDPFSAGDVTPPSPKRRRLASPPSASDDKDIVPLSTVHTEFQDCRPVSPGQPSDSKPVATGLKNGKLSSQGKGPEQQVKPKATPASVARTVSPPPVKGGKRSEPQNLTKSAKDESLTPRIVAKAPAMLKWRLAVLQKLHEQMQTQNSKLAILDEKWKALVLSEKELIKFALDEEENATRLGENVYKNMISQRVLRFKKMTTDEWIKTVADWTGASSQVKAQEKAAGNAPKILSTGLSSVNEEIAVLRHLRTALEGLERFGYVTSQPTAAEIASAQSGVAAAKGFESCDRCGTRFQVFPGRDANGHLTSGGKCRFHWTRLSQTAAGKTTRIVGRSEAHYPCCNKSGGSEGCSEAETHVFNVKDHKRLASILQFECTPTKCDVRVRQPVSFDCEMGYTTLGMEVIRVTAVSWPDGRLLLDVLVRPFGEILDLNTRFSGVTKEAYGNALPYKTADSRGQLAADESMLEAAQLRKIESPAAARQLLFSYLSPETPLIGHAIENDLNVCRIIHPFIVDTVLLYPHPRGLPVRYGLRMLSQKYLSRAIQTGGETGHDSKEDAIATGDLVTKKVAEKWSVMQHQGWTFVDGVLTAPEETRTMKSGAHVML